MKVAPPTNLWGMPLNIRQDASPFEIEAVGVALLGGIVARIRFLRWDLRDFEPATGQLEARDGWVLTLTVEAGTAGLHLWQGDGVFYTAGGRPVQHVDAATSGSVDGPQWHSRSNRFWPMAGYAPLPFRGQFRSTAYLGYVFGELADESVAVSLCSPGEQDVEDHYETEA
jgi:hypothetical protein